MKIIVITGSTRGIGFALAKAFLKRGCRVVISGRKQVSVGAAVKNLRTEFPDIEIAGFPCDVTDFSQVENLWNKAVKIFRSVDVWINNAGISNTQKSPWQLSADEIKCVVETNMLGEMYGTKVAISGFISQGYGALYNMEGMGAQGGHRVKGLSIYGATKAGLRYFNDSVSKEVDSERIIIGAIQPGMMLTEMVTGQYLDRPADWEKVKGIFAFISEKPEVVAEWLSGKILENTQNGVRFIYGGMLRMVSRLVERQFQRKQN